MPTIFPNLPSYLTKRLPAKRKSADDRQSTLERIDDERMQKFLNDDLITDFAAFTKRCDSHLSKDTWLCLKCSDLIVFYVIKVDNMPQISEYKSNGRFYYYCVRLSRKS